jgi:AsmA protein
MRALKIGAWIAGGLIALIIVAVLAIVLLVDPNDYRDRLERIVEQKTGRALTLSGDLKLSFFPWLALEVGPASLADAAGFGDEPFAAIQSARVGVRLLPILRGQIEVGAVSLDGARIRLITDEQGRDNWADLGSRQESAPASEDAGDAATTPTIASLKVTDAAVTMENRAEKTRRVVRDFNLETGRLASGEPFDLETGFVLDQAPDSSLKVHLTAVVIADLERNTHRLQKPEIDVTLSGQGYPAEGVPVQVRAESLEADIGQELYGLDAFALTTDWKGDGFPPQGVPVKLLAKTLRANLAKQTLDLDGLELDLAGALLSGRMTGEEILDAPLIRGPLQLAPVSLREWLPRLGVQPPETTDPEVLKQLSFSGDVALTKTSAEVDDVVMKLDDTTMKGELGVADLASKALRFDLEIDRINADRYLPPAAEAEKAKAKTAEKAPPTEIPVDALRKLNARGQLVIGEAIFAGMTFTKLRLGLNAREGRVRFNPAEASMYGGRYRGDISLDATRDVARVSLDEHVTGVDFAPLFKDLFETDRVSGKGGANVKLTGEGRNTDDIMRTLDGAVDFNVADGALEGADLWYEIRRARAVLKQQPIPPREGPPRTTFSALTGTGVMKDGVLANNDLNVAMQYLKATGQGAIDIPGNSLDYVLVAKVLKIPREGADASQMQDLVDAEIPVKVTGALTDPKVRPDIEGYLKGKVKERVEEEKDKVEEKLKKKLGDKLKDIFGQ